MNTTAAAANLQMAKGSDVFSPAFLTTRCGSVGEGELCRSEYCRCASGSPRHSSECEGCRIAEHHASAHDSDEEGNMNQGNRGPSGVTTSNVRVAAGMMPKLIPRILARACLWD